MTANSLYRRLHFYAGNAYRLATMPIRQRWIAPEEARTIFGSSYGADGWHHLRKTLEEYDANSGIRYTDTTLYRFLAGFAPKSICDLLPETPNEAALPLFVYPWGTFRRNEIASTKNAANSRFCGPSSDSFIAEEFERVVDLYHRLQRTGYAPWRFGHGFLGGTFLHAADGRRRFVVLQGNHRLAILAHVGERSIAVRDVPGYLTAVYERDLEQWPLVANGTCSPALARSIFRLFFDDNGRHIAARLAHGTFGARTSG